MANETLDRMAPDDYCREKYWTATDEELKAFEALVRADERERIKQANAPEIERINAYIKKLEAARDKAQQTNGSEG